MTMCKQFCQTMKAKNHSYVKDSLNRSKKTPSLPKSVVTLLNHLYRAAMGIMSQHECIPWKIKGVGFEMEKIKEFCNEEHVPFQLAVLDVHGAKEQLSTEFFSSLPLNLNTLNAQYEYVLVCFIYFFIIVMLVEGVSSQSTKVHYEFGVIHTTKDDSWTARTIEIATIALFVSKVDKFEAIDKILIEKVYISGSSGQNQEFIDRSFIDGLITRFCPKYSYVLEMFCGGVVLEQSLLKRRRSTTLCKDDYEAMALESQCSIILDGDLALQEWCGTSGALTKQTIELDDEEKEDLNNLDIDEQPSGEDEDDESEDNDIEYNVDDDREVRDVANVVDLVGTRGDTREISQDVDVEGGQDNAGATEDHTTNDEDAEENDGAIQNDGNGDEDIEVMEPPKAGNVEIAKVIKNNEDTRFNDACHSYVPSNSQAEKCRKAC